MSAAGPKNAGTVTDATFEEMVLKSKVPVLVDFWAPWCGPCRMIAPLIDELSAEYGEKLLAVSAQSALCCTIRSLSTFTGSMTCQTTAFASAVPLLAGCDTSHCRTACTLTFL